MAKQKTAHSYELELRKMIEARTGAPCEVWLYPQIRSAAMNMEMLDKVHTTLIQSDKLVKLVIGSKDQMKNEVDPLLPYYLKLQAELRLQYQALGLNFTSTPSKITEPTRKGLEDDDPMAEYYRQNK